MLGQWQAGLKDGTHILAVSIMYICKEWGMQVASPLTETTVQA